MKGNRLNHFALVSAFASCMAGTAFAEGCAFDGGASVPEIEAFNQMMLDRKFADFAAALEATANMNIDGAMQSVSQVYAEGFDGCTTTLQRREVGGLTQHLVIFHGKAGPLFVYWLYAGTGAEFALLQFNLDSGLDILENLR